METIDKEQLKETAEKAKVIGKYYIGKAYAWTRETIVKVHKRLEEEKEKERERHRVVPDEDGGL